MPKEIERYEYSLLEVRVGNSHDRWANLPDETKTLLKSQVASCFGYEDVKCFTGDALPVESGMRFHTDYLEESKYRKRIKGYAFRKIKTYEFKLAQPIGGWHSLYLRIEVLRIFEPVEGEMAKI